MGPRLDAGYSFVAAAGEHAVLKIVPPTDDESTHEADALSLWDGRGAVRVLRVDRERHALLLERARPGDDAAPLDDERAFTIAIEVGRALWLPAKHGKPFETVDERVPAWLAHVAPHPLVAEAQRIYGDLKPARGVLVHGDLHHHNLLRHGDRWVAIDPKPIIAEPEYDVVTLLWNPIGHTPDRASVKRRIALLAGAGLDESRIRAWAIVRGAYLGFPLRRDERPQHTVARLLL